MKRKLQLTIFCLFLLTILISCSDYQKLLNSDDTSEKYKQAEVYYNNGDYRKANRLFEQISPKYRGKPQAQRVIFFLADSYFQIKRYISASSKYENFIKSYPKSERIEEAVFKGAKSYYYLSPKYSLDQKDTFIAIEKLQVFINLYPNSIYSAEANQLISELQVKLEKKYFEIAKQYYTIRDYKSSIKASDNFIASFPGTRYREEALFVKFEASYKIAVNSVDSKKPKRFEDLKKQYNIILRYYPETLFIEELDYKMSNVNSGIEELNKFTKTLSK